MPLNFIPTSEAQKSVDLIKNCCILMSAQLQLEEDENLKEAYEHMLNRLVSRYTCTCLD